MNVTMPEVTCRPQYVKGGLVGRDVPGAPRPYTFTCLP